MYVRSVAVQWHDATFVLWLLRKRGSYDLYNCYRLYTLEITTTIPTATTTTVFESFKQISIYTLSLLIHITISSYTCILLVVICLYPLTEITVLPLLIDILVICLWAFLIHLTVLQSHFFILSKDLNFENWYWSSQLILIIPIYHITFRLSYIPSEKKNNKKRLLNKYNDAY